MFNVDDLSKIYEISEHVESANCRAKNIGQKHILKICDMKHNCKQDFEYEITKANIASRHNIGPRVISFGFHNNFGYILMDRLKYSLKYLIENDKITKRNVQSLKKTFKIMWKRSNFVHMDLHAENIWFDPNGSAKLIDFGMIMSKRTIDDLSEINPYTLHEGYDNPPIINSKTAFVNSTFDIRELINHYINKSVKKDNIECLKKILEGEWIN